MLSQKKNELVTRTGDATPGGVLQRSFWQPVALSEELLPDRPIPVRVLGEDLALFRDASGRPALVGLHCPHRGADLSYGRIEARGLRCLYHGWLFAPNGECLEQPGEPNGFCKKVRQTAYPCEEYGDLVFAYLGAGVAPPLPRHEALSAPAAHRRVDKVFYECNYLQGLEGRFDPAHPSFLHRFFVGQDESFNGVHSKDGTHAFRLFEDDTAPTILVDTFDGSVRMVQIRKATEDRQFVRVSYFVVPNLVMYSGRTGGDGYSVAWHVPVDDAQHWSYVVLYRRSGPLDKDALERDTEVLPTYRMKRNRGNRYLQDRDEMQASTFAGLGRSFQVHDTFVAESQGVIADRTREHLGETDRGIVAMRRALLHAVDEIESGQPTAQPSVAKLRVVSEVVPSSTAWEDLVRA